MIVELYGVIRFGSVLIYAGGHIQFSYKHKTVASFKLFSALVYFFQGITSLKLQIYFFRGLHLGTTILTYPMICSRPDNICQQAPVTSQIMNRSNTSKRSNLIYLNFVVLRRNCFIYLNYCIYVLLFSKNASQRM